VGVQIAAPVDPYPKADGKHGSPGPGLHGFD
jgi:hypothetical protein